MFKIATAFVILAISWSIAEKIPTSSCLEHVKDFRSYTHCITRRDTSRCYDGGCIRCLKGRCRLSCEGDVCRSCPMGDCCDGTNCNICVDGNCCSTVECNTCVKDCQESCLSQECRETCTQSCIAENEVQKITNFETFKESKDFEIQETQNEKFQSVDSKPCSWGNVLQSPSPLIRRVGESACAQRQTSCNSCSTSSCSSPCSQSRCAQSSGSSSCNNSPCSQNTKTITCTNGSCTQSTGCPAVQNCSQNSGCTNGCSVNKGCSQNGGCSQNNGCSQNSSGCQTGRCQNSSCQNGNCKNECSGRCSGNSCA